MNCTLHLKACGKKSQAKFLYKFDENNLNAESFFQNVVESKVPIIETGEIKKWPIVNHNLKSIAKV